MKSIVYVAKRYERAMRIALGGEVKILTSPPLTEKDFEVGSKYFRAFVKHRLVVFNLHGDAEKEYWWGGTSKWDGKIALTAVTLSKMDLRGTGVFAINCDLGDEGIPMRKALIEAQPDFFISGEGLNYGGLNLPMGADILLFFFNRQWQGTTSPELAFERAKFWTKIFSPRFTKLQREVANDTQSFTLFRR